jgi:hypothetical protein
MTTNKKVVLAVGAAFFLGIAATLLLVRAYIKPASSVAVTPPPPLSPAVPFKSQPAEIIQKAVLTRALGIEGPKALASMLDTMPVGVLAHDQASSDKRWMLWSEFFKGSLTKLGNIDSRSPLIVFYNPMMDVAVFQGCEYPTGTAAPVCQRLCAAPGEVLEGTEAARIPGWLKQGDVLKALQVNTAIRMTAFERYHPSNSKDAQLWDKGLCSSKLQSIAELRLLETTTAITRLTVKRLTEAVARYVRVTAKEARGHTVKGSKKREPDPVIELLAHLDTLSLSAAIPSSDHGWLVFLTPRHTGWILAVVVLEGAPNGQLTIRGARLLSLSSKQEAV